LRQEDETGAARTFLRFPLEVNSVAKAHYILEDTDIDGDTIPDFKEWMFYGTLANGPQTDTDGDGIDFAWELARLQSPRAVDTFINGGMSRQRSTLFRVNQIGQVPLVQDSNPPTIVSELDYYLPGTRIFIPSRKDQTAGHYIFTWFEKNGVRMVDDSGAAVYRLEFTIGSPTTVTGHFLDGAADADADSILDWQEIRFYGDLDEGPSDDTDFDGFPFAEELLREQSPRAVDTQIAGGISRQRSAMLTINPILDPTEPEIGRVFATSIGPRSATLSALINPMSSATTANFEFGLTDSYGNSIASASILNGFSAAPMTALLTGLTPDTEYHFRVIATNSFGQRVSKDFTFRTLPELTGLEIWMQQNGITSLEGDRDKDGLRNIWEFFTFSDPRLPDRSPGAFYIEDGFLRYEYTRSRTAVADNYVFTVEWTDDPETGNWLTAGVVQRVLLEGIGYQMMQASVPLPTIEEQVKILRLRVEPANPVGILTHPVPPRDRATGFGWLRRGN